MNALLSIGVIVAGLYGYVVVAGTIGRFPHWFTKHVEEKDEHDKFVCCGFKKHRDATTREDIAEWAKWFWPIWLPPVCLWKLAKLLFRPFLILERVVSGR